MKTFIFAVAAATLLADSSAFGQQNVRDSNNAAQPKPVVRGRPAPPRGPRTISQRPPTAAPRDVVTFQPARPQMSPEQAAKQKLAQEIVQAAKNRVSSSPKQALQETRDDIIPRYGRYGGPGYSGGADTSKIGGKSGSLPPIDSMDEKFKKHDDRYTIVETLKKNGNFKEAEAVKDRADRQLIKDLEGLNPDPRKWEKPPPSWIAPKATVYRNGAIATFKGIVGK